MFSSIRRSWDLGRASWRVLREHPSLLVFTLIGFALAAVSAGIVIGGAFAVFSDGWIPDSYDDPNASSIVVAALVMFCATFFTIYFNTGLTASVLELAHNRPVSVGRGIALANARIGVILQWTAISVTVGLLMRALRERGGIAGTVVSMIGNFAWGLATFFVIPVLATKHIGPIDAIRQSAGLLRRTWGEQIVGEAGVGIFAIIISAPVWIVALLAIAFGAASGSTGALVAGIAVGGLLLVLVAAFVSTLSTVYRAVLYRWATEHQATADFSEAELSGAFRAKA